MDKKEMKDQILTAIVQYITDHGYPPTVREIGEATGIRGLSQIHECIRQMIRDGELQTDSPRSPRALRVPGYKFVRAEEAQE